MLPPASSRPAETKREPAAAPTRKSPQSQPGVSSMQPACSARAVALVLRSLRTPSDCRAGRRWLTVVAPAGPPPDPFADSSLAAKNQQQAFIKR